MRLNTSPCVRPKVLVTWSMISVVLGRMAAYTGQLVEWDFATNDSELNLFPENFDINGTRPEPKHAVPGETKLI